MNALNEKASIIQAELEAKASADTLDNWIKAYQDFVKANDTARAQAEKDLISASQRVSTIAKDLGELSDRWNFIDTYMSSSNEGLVIGKNDGSSSMMFNLTVVYQCFQQVWRSCISLKVLSTLKMVFSLRLSKLDALEKNSTISTLT
ncbi:hypothetical protein [Streptococcus pseudoporcinus]|uniref:hypothetical protein n=1 Tax=Streptococcus pseudoporcinus TaxID=361101 RepID=UPI00216927FF|nr:hypothetical protein [Streptococcus pseudoporcinus]